ncbi:TPA: hypothetical protein DCQ44_01720 [Candidatus Taylorbacteria bacterium]|nr:hypothetical protein [Candidatus Taylorbacteria bacterium]
MNEKTITKTSNYIYEYISTCLSQGEKITIPSKVLEQEGISLDEVSDYFIVEHGSFGLIHFKGFRKAL